jgi:hypothetical protein
MVFGAVAVIKKNTMHFGSVGMPFSLNHASSDDTRNGRANFVNTFNSKTNIGQGKGNCVDVIGQIGQISNP